MQICFTASRFRTLFHLHQIIEARERTRNFIVFLLNARPGFVFVFINLCFKWCEGEKSLPGRIWQYFLTLFCVRFRTLLKPIIAKRCKVAKRKLSATHRCCFFEQCNFPSLPCTSSLCVCFFFTFCRNYLDREKCLQFVYLRYFIFSVVVYFRAGYFSFHFIFFTAASR